MAHLVIRSDYDGDGKTDFAVWRPSTGQWWVIHSSDGSQHTQQWGAPGDIPVPGDYDGDGKTDFAVWRPSTGQWWVIHSSDGSQHTQQWGAPGDIPSPIPAGALGSYFPISLPSASLTPSSMVFNASGSIQGSPPRGKWFPRQEVKGVTLSNSSRVVELRGWLSYVNDVPNGADPDWALGIEPDPQWLDSMGADWTTFIKVGDLLNPPWPLILTSTDDLHAWAGTPHIELEVCGFPASNFPWAKQLPGDWTLTDLGGLAGVTWPYVPTNDGGSLTGRALKPGDYVRVSGSLVTDEPHLHTNATYDAAAQDWSAGFDAFDESNPARWTEVHPPDLIELVPDPGRSECLYAVAVVARSGVLDPGSTDRSITVTLPAPPQGRPNQRVAVREYVGTETDPATITEGNASLSGALIVPGADSATVHVAVRGQPFAGKPGKFKAVYRVSWQDSPDAVTWVDQSGNPLVEFTGSVHDWSSGVAVAPADTGRLIKGLTLVVTTGDDDLRGGTGPGDNCDVILQLQAGAPLTFANINQGAHWNNGETHTVPLTIPPGLAAGAIVGLTLHTQFGGGVFGDNWKVNQVILQAAF
jgi:hypothetical protein